MRVLTRVTAVWLIAAWVLAPGSAVGHDHRPPATVLRRHAEAIQRGYLLQYCWTTSVEDGVATGQCVDKTWSFPRGRAARPGDRLVIRIRKPSKPREFGAQAWPERGDEFTGPQGEAESLPVVLRPRRVDGQIVAWNAVFTVAESKRHYFIRAGGVWRDEQGAESDQDAYWLFHVRT